MKNIFFYILLSSFISFAQNKDCCDSIKNISKKRVHKSFNKKTTENNPYEINITVDNSNSANNYAKAKSFEDYPNEKKENLELEFDWNELYKNLITIFLGLVAAFIALYQMKSNIISSARIRWIEDLKDCLSKFYTVSLDVVNSYENYVIYSKENDRSNKDAYYNSYDSHMTHFNILMNRIKMQLNSSEVEHRQIEEIIDRIDLKLGKINVTTVTQQEIEIDLKQIVMISKIIFKKEWEKSKKLFEI